jgi:hypothetical protein
MTRHSVLHRIVLLVLVAMLIVACGKKKAPMVSSIVLESGKGAVMVVFPQMSQSSAENWLAMINLDGPFATNQLPRMPFADLQSVMVYNIVPGKYKIVASAAFRKSQPSYGGSLDSLDVHAGELIVLSAKALGQEASPYPNVRLDYVEHSPWTLESSDKLHDYIADMADDVKNQ